MEEFIRDIVEADNQARASVKNKKQERFNIQNLIQSHKEEIKKRYQEETKICIATKEDEMKKELRNEIDKETQVYTESLKKMQTKYDTQKEHWISEIVNRCLAS